LEWRPQASVAVRFSSGSSIAPPFLDLHSQANQIVPPAHSGPGSYATQILNSGTLRPETAFGYDLGSDYAFKDGVTFASTDFYLTDLFNQFLTETYVNGTCPISVCGSKGIPLYTSTNVNLSNARYEGIELSLKRIPAAGWGVSIAGSTQRGYAYHLPPGFYCGAPGCVPGVPKTYNANLGIIAGQNYIGEFVNNMGSTTDGVSNQSVPYLQGNAQLQYRFRNGAFALFGDTLYGKNNSFNRPPFGVAYLSISYPFNRDLAFQVSGYNVFNTYSGVFPVFGGGVTVPLVNGQSAGTIGNVLGPARYLFLLTKAVGP
jgi:outer membrane receptor protein involved in Fe transport